MSFKPWSDDFTLEEPVIDDRAEFEKFWASKDAFEPAAPPAREPRVFVCSQDYSSWTDADLFRAIKADPDSAEEYAQELRQRKADRAEQAKLEDELRNKYRL